MAFKFDIGYKGKTYHLEADADSLVGKKLGDTVSGTDINSDLNGAEFQITGASDIAGFPASEDVEGTGLKRVLLTEGFGMKKKHKKKKTSNPKLVKGLRLRRTLRGNTISSEIVQINLKLTKEGSKPLPVLLGKEGEVSKEGGKKKEAVGEKSAEETQKEMQEMMAKAKAKESEKKETEKKE